MCNIQLSNRTLTLNLTSSDNIDGNTASASTIFLQVKTKVKIRFFETAIETVERPSELQRNVAQTTNTNYVYLFNLLYCCCRDERIIYIRRDSLFFVVRSCAHLRSVLSCAFGLNAQNNKLSNSKRHDIIFF